MEGKFNIHVFEVTRQKRRLIGEYYSTHTFHNLVLNTSHEIRSFNKAIMIKFFKDLFEKEKIDVANKEFKVYFYDTSKITVPICYRVIFNETGEMTNCYVLYYDCDSPNMKNKGE